MSKKNEHAVSMKTELSVTKITKRGDGQASGGDQDQPAEITTMEQTSEVRVTIITSWGEKLNKLKDALTEAAQKQNAEPKIQKVPFLLRDHKNFDNYYEPRVVAFGPYHHGKRKYERAEKVKLQLAAHFITDSHHDQTNYGETLLKMVEDKIKELRECYDEEATKDYGDEVLAWMLFVDGCSMLEFIYKYDNLEEINIKRDRVAFADQDMLLLENQLPYRLLKWLFDKSKIREKFNNSIEAFVKMHGGEPKVNATEREPLHLLDLLRTRMVRPPSPSSKPGCTQLLDRLWKRKAGPPRTEPGSHSFRNVQELQAAGIYFRPSDEKSLRAISFKPWFQCCGFLHLPKIKVDDSMGPKFMNMIAYEMCPDFQNDFEVTSYIGFLDSLIDHPDDVKHLRKKRIVHPDDVKHLRKKRIVQNLLGSDEEVARLFNEIGTDLVPNNAIYRNVTAQIEDHYKTKWKTWMTQFFHDHFSSPWTIFAFFGVLLGLGLSGAQTWYAIFSNPSPCDAVCKYLKTHPG